MAKKVRKTVRKTAKKVVKKVLDSTELDEKIVANIDKNRSLYNLILHQMLWWIPISSRCWMYIRS